MRPALERVRAELIADGGLAASSDDFFRCPMYLAAEGVTHTLLLESGVTRLAAPITVRPVPDHQGLIDATSPYGFPGFSLEREGQLDVSRIDWPAHLVSLFIRHRLDAAPLSMAERRSTVHVIDPGRTIRIRRGHRYEIGRNERRGFTTNCVPGPETSLDDRVTFTRHYSETMVRVRATSRYQLSLNYFDQLLSSPSTKLILAVAPNGEPAAGAILVASDGWLHYFLSGTANRYQAFGPVKNVVMRMVAEAIDRGMPLNLGGGLKPGDGLDLFKQGFANTTVPFVTSNIVTNAQMYASLCDGGDGSGFFPAYRTPDAASTK